VPGFAQTGCDLSEMAHFGHAPIFNSFIFGHSLVPIGIEFAPVKLAVRPMVSLATLVLKPSREPSAFLLIPAIPPDSRMPFWAQNYSNLLHTVQFAARTAPVATAHSPIWVLIRTSKKA
jgi:hypothetical protein